MKCLKTYTDYPNNKIKKDCKYRITYEAEKRNYRTVGKFDCFYTYPKDLSLCEKIFKD